jgi:hypothetical protein
LEGGKRISFPLFYPVHVHRAIVSVTEEGACPQGKDSEGCHKGHKKSSKNSFIGFLLCAFVFFVAIALPSI